MPGELTPSPPPPLPSGEALAQAADELDHMGFEWWAVAIRTAATTLSALRTERDTLAGQVARLEAVREAAATLVTSMRDGWFPEDPPHTGSFIQRQYVDALRAALAGADGQEAG